MAVNAKVDKKGQDGRSGSDGGARRRRYAVPYGHHSPPVTAVQRRESEPVTEALTEVQTKKGNELNQNRHFSPSNFHKDPGIVNGIKTNAPSLQARLKIGQPGDKYEQEADETAKKVVNAEKSVTPRGEAPSAGNLQSKSKESTAKAVEKPKGPAGLGIPKIDFKPAEAIQNRLQAKNGPTGKNGMVNGFSTKSVPTLSSRLGLPEIQKAEEATEEFRDAESETSHQMMDLGSAAPPAIQQSEEETVAETPEIQAKEEALPPGDTSPEIQPSADKAFAPPGDEGEGASSAGASVDSSAPAPLMLKSESGESFGTSALESRLDASKGQGSSLPADTQEHMGSQIGADFSGVKVHTGSDAQEMNQSLGAQAFTHGSDIYFNEGKYDTSSPAGNELLAHELTHTVQQGAAPAVQTKPAIQLQAEPELQAQAETLAMPVPAQKTTGESAGKTPDVQASVISEIVDLADWVGISITRIADNIPGYTLFRYIIGYDILRDRSVSRDTRGLIQGLMGLVIFGNLVFEKLDSYGVIDKAITWVESNLARLNLTTGRLMDAASDAWDRMGVSEGISGNLRILRDEFQPLLDDVEEFASDAAAELLELVKEGMLTPLVGYLEENSPAYKLATKVIGSKFPLEDPVEATTVEILEDFLILIGKETEVEQMKEKGVLQETADWIDTQLGTFFSLLGRFQAIVTRVWDAISLSSLQDVPKILSDVFNDFVDLLNDFLDFALTVALKVLELVKKSVLGWLAGFANDVPGFHLMTVILGKNPFTEEVVPRTTENIIRGFMGLVPGGEAKFQELKETGVVPDAAARIDALVERLGISWEMIVATFMGIWDSLSIDDLINPVAAFQRIVDAFGEPVARIFTFVVEVVKILVELILAIMNFPSELIGQLIGNVMSAFEEIKNDPIGFLLNLLKAVKLGFEQFFSNFLSHLMKGLQTWLFGELEGAGISPPEDISFESILGMVMDVLGITLDNVLERLALKIGEEKVEKIRGALDTLTGIWTFVKDVIERGPIAIWEYVQEKINNLWDMVVDAIKTWIMEKIITAVTTKLLSMLDPTGVMAVVNSFIAFFRAVQSFIDKLREMLEIMNTFVLGVLDIARGNIKPAADYLEQALSDGVPVAIGFLANQVGLGNLGEKVGEMIEMARAKVNEGIDWLIDKAMQAGRAIMDKLGLGEEGEITEEDKEKHAQYLKEIEDTLTQKKPEEGMPYEKFHAQMKAEALALQEQYQKKLKTGIKLTIEFSPVDKDEEDGDMDLKLIIAPNTSTKDVVLQANGGDVATLKRVYWEENVEGGGVSYASRVRRTLESLIPALQGSDWKKKKKAIQVTREGSAFMELEGAIWVDALDEHTGAVDELRTEAELGNLTQAQAAEGAVDTTERFLASVERGGSLIADQIETSSYSGRITIRKYVNGAREETASQMVQLRSEMEELLDSRNGQPTHFVITEAYLSGTSADTVTQTAVVPILENYPNVTIKLILLHQTGDRKRVKNPDTVMQAHTRELEGLMEANRVKIAYARTTMILGEDVESQAIRYMDVKNPFIIFGANASGIEAWELSPVGDNTTGDVFLALAEGSFRGQIGSIH